MLDTVTELVAPKSISPALETRQIKAGSSQNCPNIEKSVIFTQELPKSVVSTRFNWAEDAAELPTLSTLSTASTKSPRDFSGLLSSSSSKNHSHRSIIAVVNSTKMGHIFTILNLNIEATICFLAPIFTLKSFIQATIHGGLPQFLWTGTRTLVWLTLAMPYVLSAGFEGDLCFYCFIYILFCIFSMVSFHKKKYFDLFIIYY